MIDARHYFVKPQGSQRNPNAGLIGIAVHHSVSGDYLGEHATELEEIAHLQAIESFHLSQGYGLIGYHAAAFASGRCYQLGNFDGQRAHIAGRNHVLRGVVAIGTFTHRLPSKKQLGAMAEGIQAIRDFVGRDLPIRGHNEWALPGQGTGCAGRMNGLDWTPYLTTKPAPEPEEEDMASLLAWVDWDEKPPGSDGYKSWLLFITPEEGIKNRWVPHAAEHNSLLSSGVELKHWTRSQLEQAGVQL